MATLKAGNANWTSSHTVNCVVPIGLRPFIGSATESNWLVGVSYTAGAFTRPWGTPVPITLYNCAQLTCKKYAPPPGHQHVWLLGYVLLVVSYRFGSSRFSC